MTDQIEAILNAGFMVAYIFIVLTTHEMGHYLAARFFGIGVESFSLGYGDKLWSATDSRGTHWVVRLFPIGGHVHLAAQEREAKGVLFGNAPPWQRMVVILAGPLANLTTAFTVLFLFFVLCGQPSKQPVVAGVEPGGPAWEAGLKTGDRIVEIEGHMVRRYRDVWRYTYGRPGKPLTLRLLRDGRIYETVLTPALSQYVNGDGIEKTHGRVGILVGYNPMILDIVETVDGIETGRDGREKARALLRERMGRPVTIGLTSVDGRTHEYMTVLDPALNAALGGADSRDRNIFNAGPVGANFYLPLDVTGSLIAAGVQTGLQVGAVARLPFQLFPVDREMLQPWAVVTQGDHPAKRTLYEFCYRLALISVVIALLNMIPFPGLDGNLLLQTAVEAAAGRDSPAGLRAYKYLLLGMLGLLYGGVILSNAGDFPRYLHNRITALSFPVEADRESR